eukprot:1517235-Lingulodinium_polyedra.AAC.1
MDRVPLPSPYCRLVCAVVRPTGHSLWGVGGLGFGSGEPLNASRCAYRSWVARGAPRAAYFQLTVSNSIC